MPTVLVTICTIRQLPQAFALGDSFLHHTTDSSQKPELFLIGLADDPAHLPANFVSPYPILPIGPLLQAPTLATLSATYTPTEFSAACKPLFLAEVFRQYPDVSRLLFADPNVLFLHSLNAVWDLLREANALLTPHVTSHYNDTAWPDEKHFQNIGLYSADFLAFQRSEETDRLLAWWQDRVQERAYIDFCAGLCTDQLWLMHMPVFFPATRIIKNPGWHVALWNLPGRILQTNSSGWQTDTNQPVVFMNAKGLFNIDEGFFPNQNRLRLSTRPDVQLLISQYKQAVAVHANPGLTTTFPALGLRPEPVVLHGWRRATVRSMRAITRFLDQIPLPVLR